MELTYTSYSLLFKHPFGVSSNIRNETPCVFIRLKEGGLEGYGEACLPLYLGETTEETIRFFGQAKAFLQSITTSFPIQDIRVTMDSFSPKNNAAKAAIDIALHDLYAKAAGKSFLDFMGLQTPQPKATSFTIGLDSDEKLKQKIEDAKDFEILKIKAGTTNDKSLIEKIRQFTDKPLYVDVNQGWTKKETVLEMLNWMAGQGVIMIEQPLPKERKTDMKWITERSPIPTFADESIKRLSDLHQFDGSFSGINIKLMKCTGLFEALKMIDYCKQHSIKILLGCMAESSCATTAMAQLTGFADFVDLDAPQLYSNDPFTGVNYKNGKLHLPTLNGIGVAPKEVTFFD